MQAICSEVELQGNQPTSPGWPETLRQAGVGSGFLIQTGKEYIRHVLVGNFSKCGNKDHSNENKESLYV